MAGLLAAASLLARVIPGQSPQFRIVEEAVVADRGLLAADFDGDGDIDLLTREPPALQLNDGSARFTRDAVMPPFLADPGARPCAAGDVDGDGRSDVFVASWIGGILAPQQVCQLWIHDGTGAWIPGPMAMPTVPPGVLIRDVCIADLDGDGDLDLTFTTEHLWGGPPPPPGSPGLWLNEGRGQFTGAIERLPAVAAWARSVAVADFDNDGDQDLLYSIAGSAGYQRLVAWSTGGVFIAGPPIAGAGPCTDTLVVGDPDGDGWLDFLGTSGSSPCTGSSVQLLSNLGGGTFGVPTALASGAPGDAVLLDVDGDGQDEFVAVTQGGMIVREVVPFVGLAPPSQTLGVFASQPIVADFDQDGDEDLAVRTAQGVRVLLNDHQGSLVPLAGRITTPGSLVPPVLADVEGDGDLDLLGIMVAPGGSGTTPWVAWNDGHGLLDFQFTSGLAGGPLALCAGVSLIHPFDADGDGDADFLAANVQLSGNLGHQIVVNDGPVFQARPPLSVLGVIAAARAGDLDGNGIPDLVLARGPVPWAPGPGSGPALVICDAVNAAAAAPMPLPAITWTRDFELFDADGDGDLDLVAAQETTSLPGAGPSVLLINDGAGSFSLSPSFPAVSAASVAVGDLDGDGDQDVLLDGSVVRNDGAGAFAVIGALPSASGAPPLPNPPRILLDADGDGDLDVVDGSGRLFRNDGLGFFPASEPAVDPLAMPGAPLAAGDLDGDGDPDLVTDRLRLLVNASRHLARGRTPRLGRVASLEVFGPPGAAWALFAAPWPAQVALPPYGVAFIDPATAVLVAPGTIGGDGSAAVATFVPNDPSLIDLSVFWQAAVLGPGGARLTNQVATVVRRL